MLSTISREVQQSTLGKFKFTMECNKDFRFEVSISKDAYKSKEETNAAIMGDNEGRVQRKNLGLKDKLCFKTQTVTPQELLDLALHGYTFCHPHSGFPSYNPQTHTVYLRKDGYYTLAAKSDQYFCGSSIVVIDIDETNYESARQFVSQLSMTPTFWYTSISNLTKDKNGDGKLDARQRIGYAFNQKIEDKYFFRYVSSLVHHQVELDTNEEIKDKCGLKCSQYFNGTNIEDPSVNTDYGISNIIYSLSDFDVTAKGFLDFLDRNCDYKPSSLTDQVRYDINMRKCALFPHKEDYTCPLSSSLSSSTYNVLEWGKSAQHNCKITDDDFDIRMIKSEAMHNFEDFRQKNKPVYHYTFRKERPNDWLMLGDVKYQLCDDEYLEVPWIVKKIGVGKGRHYILLCRGVLRRLMEPNITPTALLYNLICDREWFCDNSDGEITTKALMNIVKQCFAYDVDELKVVYKDVYDYAREKCKNKEFIIHYSSRGKIRANSLAKELRWQFLDQVYDPKRSERENLKMLEKNDCGKKVGFTSSALYRYCKARGIKGKSAQVKDKMELFKQLHNDYMSLREEVEFLKANGLPISMTTLRNYIKRLKEEQAA